MDSVCRHGSENELIQRVFTKVDTPFSKDAEGVNAGEGAIVTGGKEKDSQSCRQINGPQKAKTQHCQQAEPRHL